MVKGKSQPYTFFFTKRGGGLKWELSKHQLGKIPAHPKGNIARNAYKEYQSNFMQEGLNCSMTWRNDTKNSINL